MCHSNCPGWLHVDDSVTSESWIRSKDGTLPGGPFTLCAGSRVSCRTGAESSELEELLWLGVSQEDVLSCFPDAERWPMKMHHQTTILSQIHVVLICLHFADSPDRLPGVWVLSWRAFPYYKAKEWEKSNGEKMSSYLFLSSAPQLKMQKVLWATSFVARLRM